jgi:tetratricopeptide (TPR) repeat protein
MRVIDHLHSKRITPSFRRTLIYLFSMFAIILFSTLMALHAPAQSLSASADPYKLGLLKSEKGDYDGAISEFNRVIENSLSRPQSFATREYANRAKTDHNNFILYYDNLAVVVSRQAAAYCARGLAWYAKGNLAEAEADFEQTINLAPRYLEAYLNLGATKQLKQDPEGALALYNQALKINPRDIAVYFNRAVAYYTLQDIKSALADLEKAVGLEPDNPAVYVNRGNFWTFIQQYDKALADYNRAISLNAGLASAYNNRGNVYFIAGKTGDALLDFERALKCKPTLAEAYLNRGLIRFAEGKRDEAEADFRRCREMDSRLGTSIDERINEIGSPRAVTAVAR